MSDAMQTTTVSCLACDTAQEIRYRLDQPVQRFACVRCGRKSVVSPKVATTPAKEARDPKKPWALSATDREILTTLRVQPS